jgi:hypothetical protein
MSKKTKTLVTIIITVVIGYSIYFYFGVIKPRHSFNWQTYKQYMWIFKKPIRSEIDTFYCGSYVHKQDIYNNFHYKTYTIIVWEFKNLRDVELKKVAFNQNIYLEDLKFKAGQVLNANSHYLPITIKNTYSFKNLMQIDIGTDSKIEKQINGPNYKGFYGEIKRMALRNENGGDQILFDYVRGPTPTVCLVYKGHNSFFLIVINNINKPLNPDIIKILNLK